MPGFEKEQLCRREFCFWGQVQGVGFRWRAQWAASALDLTGWVENQDDGSVCLHVQGPESAIDQMILKIEAGRYVCIENFSCRNLPLQPDERGFSVR